MRSHVLPVQAENKIGFLSIPKKLRSQRAGARAETRGKLLCTEDIQVINNSQMPR